MNDSPLSGDLPVHGGDLAAADARWGRPPAGWLDLSTGINPWPYPVPAIPAEAWHRLPGAAHDLALRRAACGRYGATGPDHVLAAPGTSALIWTLPAIRPVGSVAVLGPTYGDHAAAWASGGHGVDVVDSLDGLQGAQVAVVVNPNNPDGRLVPPARLAELALRLGREGGLLVVDEAFADAVPTASTIPILPELPPCVIVLRSFGKFYGLAGLRLGFALGPKTLLLRLAARLGPWPVAGPAMAIGRMALDDADWAEATCSRLAGMSARLDEVLAAATLEIVGGTSLFRLARHPAAHALWERLGAAGILTRAFPNRPNLLRFGLPASDAELDRLARSLA